jgi:hypothetical protein
MERNKNGQPRAQLLHILHLRTFSAMETRRLKHDGCRPLLAVVGFLK